MSPRPPLWPAYAGVALVRANAERSAQLALLVDDQELEKAIATLEQAASTSPTRERELQLLKALQRFRLDLELLAARDRPGLPPPKVAAA